MNRIRETRVAERPDRVVWEPDAALDGTAWWPDRVRVATLGPDGTTSAEAVEWLRDHLAFTTAVEPVLLPSFEQLLAAASKGETELALVPSAATSATRFFWSPRLELVGFFTRATPTYGVAAPPEAAMGRRPVRVASLPETRDLIELASRWLDPSDVRWVDAASTQDAARLASLGHADLAVTNEPGMRAHQLRFLVSRAGVRMLWLLFAHVGFSSGSPRAIDRRCQPPEGDRYGS